jgi:predicted transcriptional regulator
MPERTGANVTYEDLLRYLCSRSESERTMTAIRKHFEMHYNTFACKAYYMLGKGWVSRREYSQGATIWAITAAGKKFLKV